MDGEASKGCADFVCRYWQDDGPLPKHEKLRQAVTASIAEGFWQPGERLPTETEWVAATPCSLGTVQRALRALVEDGLIARRRGSGTTVAEFAPPLDDPLHMRFFDAAVGIRKFLPVTSTILSRKLIRDKGAWSEDIDQRDRQVVRFDRVMHIADDLDVYSVFYAVAEEFPDMVNLPMDMLHGVDLKKILASRSHNPLYRVRQHMRFEPVPPWVKAACRWPGEASASILNVVGFGVDGSAMYYQDLYIPPTSYSLDLGAPLNPQK